MVERVRLPETNTRDSSNLEQMLSEMQIGYLSPLTRKLARRRLRSNPVRRQSTLALRRFLATSKGRRRLRRNPLRWSVQTPRRFITNPKGRWVPSIPRKGLLRKSLRGPSLPFRCGAETERPCQAGSWVPSTPRKNPPHKSLREPSLPFRCAENKRPCQADSRIPSIPRTNLLRKFLQVPPLPSHRAEGDLQRPRHDQLLRIICEDVPGEPHFRHFRRVENKLSPHEALLKCIPLVAPPLDYQHKLEFFKVTRRVLEMKLSDEQKKLGGGP